MSEKCEGDLALAVPHQDVLILADITNDSGYDILAQMTMKFFAEGRIPITSLAFIYENKKLEPIFIMAKNKRSEEHTSELQSRGHLVCRLLLEKKKKKVDI